MYIRSLPRSRPSKNRRRSGRWVRCLILDRQWVPPNARIGLYLLDDKRREVSRATNARDQPIEFTADAEPSDLHRALRHYGEGRYRLVARSPKGRIVARRDFEASIWPFAEDDEPRQYAPRDEIERLKPELRAAQEAAAAAEAERDAARAEAAALTQLVAERDAEIDQLEAALAERGAKLARARRVRWEREEAVDEVEPAPPAVAPPPYPTPATMRRSSPISSASGFDLATVEKASDVLFGVIDRLRRLDDRSAPDNDTEPHPPDRADATGGGR